MCPYFEKLIQIPEIHKECFVMVISWLNDWIENRELYDKFVSTGKNAKLCALKVAEEYLFHKHKLDEKAISILFQFLEEKEKDFSGKYSGIILRKFKENYFLELFSFMNAYSQSNLCKAEPHYFLLFLIKCSKNHPEECLQLLSNMDFGTTPNIQREYYDKEPIQLVLAIYSKLVSENKKDKEKIRITLDVFDSMLRHRHLRNNANNAIELIL